MWARLFRPAALVGLHPVQCLPVCSLVLGPSPPYTPRRAQVSTASFTSSGRGRPCWEDFRSRAIRMDAIVSPTFRTTRAVVFASLTLQQALVTHRSPSAWPSHLEMPLACLRRPKQPPGMQGRARSRSRGARNADAALSKRFQPIAQAQIRPTERSYPNFA
jgi:hypothetical protein